MDAVARRSYEWPSAAITGSSIGSVEIGQVYSSEGGPRASEVTVDGGYLLRLVISLPGPDGQMRNPMMVNFIDVYLQMLNEVVSRAGWRQAELPSQRRAV